MSDASVVRDAAVIRIICGPTAAGKSGIAMALADQHGLTIVSADSRQIYRGFDIGTAKPGAAERTRVPHACIDVAEPTDRWSAARWADDATRAIEAVGEERALVVGGTGLYLRALTGAFFVEPDLNPVERAQLERELETWSLDELRAEAARLDPPRAHLGRTQLMRAIQVTMLTGKALSDWHRETVQAPRFRARWLVVDPGTGIAEHIERRLDAMLEGGWVEEAGRLAREVPDTAPAWQGCGYVTARNIAHGTETVANGRMAILVHTRQYAKRQRTWFRHQLGAVGSVTRVDPRASGADRLVREWWEAEDGS